MATEVFVDELPDCDFASLVGHEKREALYDAATTMGPWGYLCEECFDLYGYGLGTGRGQKLVVRK